MNETLKRALSGAVYIGIMWFGASFHGTFHILFFLILFLSLYEMYKLRRGKSKIIPFLYFSWAKDKTVQNNNKVESICFIIKYFGLRIYNSYSEFSLFCLAFEMLAFSSKPVRRIMELKYIQSKIIIRVPMEP